MDKVVYFLGAGFSAPLGLPVMDNFLDKAKDMHSSDSAKYAHFQSIFRTINSLHVMKTYYYGDLLNIEEILSILEMQNLLSGHVGTKEFQRFLKDVIDFCTPEPDQVTGEKINESHYDEGILGGRRWLPYGAFVASLLGLKIIYRNGERGPGVQCVHTTNRSASYSVITLNYDTILETALDLCTRYGDQGVKGISPQFHLGEADESQAVCATLPIAKLHGTMAPLTIVPPTWNKGSSEQVLPAWRLALRLLKEANYIRVLGYSLHESDSYVRYLLKSAVLDSEHLKGFDVITLDPDGSVGRRYKAFIQFRRYRFKILDIRRYLERVRARAAPGRNEGSVWKSFDELEGAHEAAMAP